MRKKIKIKGWQKGAQKISLINKLSKEGDMIAAQAKNIKDRVVDYNEEADVIFIGDKAPEMIIAEF